METDPKRVFIFVLLVLSGCAGDKREPVGSDVGLKREQLTAPEGGTAAQAGRPGQRVPDQADSEPGIGEPCDRTKDGWQRPQFGTQEAVDRASEARGTVPHQVPRASDEITDVIDMPLGTKYCLVGISYPKGYMTATCRADADCPDKARCVGNLCRRPCDNDSECEGRSRCYGAPGSVRFCSCGDCVRDLLH